MKETLIVLGIIILIIIATFIWSAISISSMISKEEEQCKKEK